ncbi:hypothetical protein [Nonomuraea sp. NPDC049750]|uniref:hypothetical protein n=1 Tax=Nonomuraea sp. NPDC049750 TaxID=3154738 RepID=UPI0033D8C919
MVAVHSAASSSSPPISRHNPRCFFGVITVDVEPELAKLDGGGWRPPRPGVTDAALL